MADIMLAGQSYALPKNTIPYLVELAGHLDNEAPGLAGAIARNGRIVASALKYAGAEVSLADEAEIGFEELSRLAGDIMRRAGFQWGEAAPAIQPAANDNQAASPDSSGTPSAPSAPDAATAGP